MAAENDSVEVGKVSLGIELATESLSKQAPKLEKAVEKAAGRAGQKVGEKIADETAKGIEKGSSKAEKAGEKTGEKTGKAARKGIARGSGEIASESGKAGDKAGKNFLSRFKKNLTGAGGLKSLAGTIGKALFAAFATRKLFDFGKYAVNLGSDLNEVQNVVDSTFGQGSKAQKAVNDFAQNAAAQFGLSETMAKRYAGTFGAMSKAFGFADDQAAEMSTTLTGLAGDVASFYNITQDEAYTKLKSVFTGETESLKDLGVVMTQTALDQYALQQGLGTTTAHMSEQEKVALRYRFVLDKLSTASGDFARTSGSWANQVRLLKLQFESLSATIGQVLIAALTPAIRALNAFMGALVKAANTFKSFIFSLFGLESQDMGIGAGSALPDALGAISGGAGDAADSLGDVGDAAKGAGKDASKAANEIKRSLASFDKITKLSDQNASGNGSGGSGGGSGGGGGGGGTGGAGSLGDTSSALTNTAYTVAGSNGPLDKIMEKLKALKDLFMNGFWEGFGDIAVFDSIQSNIEGIKEHLKDIFTDPGVLKAAEEYGDKVAQSIGKKVGAVASIGATIADNLTGGFNRYLEQHEEDIKQFIIRMFDISGEIADIKGNFAAAIADVFTVFRSDDAKQITADLINIFATAFGTVIEASAKFSRDILANITKPFVDNKAKIKEVLEGILGQIRTVISSISDVVTSASKTIEKLYDGHIKPLIDSLGNGISDIVGLVLVGWEQYIRPVLNALSDKFADVCEDHIIPMIESLGDALGGIVDLIKVLWETILQPLIKWIIKNIMPLIGDLIELMGGAFLDAISEVADYISNLSKGIKVVAGFLSDLITAIKGLPEKAQITLTGIKDKAFDTVKAAWESIKDKTAEIKATVSQFVDNIKTKVLDFQARLVTWIQSLKDKVLDFQARLTSWVQDLKDKVIGFQARLTSWTQDLNDKVLNFKARLTSWQDSLKDKAVGFKAKLTSWQDSLKNKLVSFKAKLTSWQDSLKNKVVNFKAKLTSWKDSLSNKVLSFKAKLTSFFRKDGGVYSGGRWRPIQSYASGGTPDGGQLFVAREAGPELVGTLGGHTAVMNNDQIVASVSAGVARAISGIKFYARGQKAPFMAESYLPRLADTGNGIRNDTAQLVAYAKQAEAASGAGNTREIIELLKKILEILIQIDPDIYIDGEKVTSRIVNIINAKTRATGRSAIIV